MIVEEELLKHKERVDIFSRKVKKTCETLQGLCNEILFDHDPISIDKDQSDVNSISEILLFQVSKKVNEHLNRTRLLLNAYEEYSEMFDKTFTPAELSVGGDSIPNTISVNKNIR